LAAHWKSIAMNRGLETQTPPTPLALPAGVVLATDQINPDVVLRELELNRDEQSQASFSGDGGPDDSELAYSPADLLEVLLVNSPDPIYFKDRRSRFVCYSQAFSDVYRLAETDALRGKSDFDLFTEEHARQAYEDEQHIIRTGEPIVGKLERETHNDGRVTWALTTKMPWRDRQGNVIGTFGISKDVTQLKATEQTLAHERELFQALVENLPDAIYFKDLESRFVKLSRSKVERARKNLVERHRTLQGEGEEPDAPVAPHLADAEACAQHLVGKTDFDLMDAAAAQNAFQQEQEIIRTGQPMIGRMEKVADEEGKPAWRLTTKMPWRDAAGNIVGTFGVTRDITALKEAEARLEEIHKRLAHTSRMAGMAEVATDILHNVGNVLNSVNVSCSLVTERLQESPAANLARIPQMLQAHAGQLEDFLTKDPKGAKIPDYLAVLAQTIETQRVFALQEMEQLRRHVDHIKQVVAMQQNYAKVAGVEEQVAVTDLIEDALRLNSSALERHQVVIRRDIEPVPPLIVDKHKVLQILVNLISNAKYAISAVERPDKLMTVRVRPQGPDRIVIQVVDQGTGIAPENLTRIFAHGFTTRPDGHGFGLHSGAIAATELGGALTATSAGLGHGATFTLELPLRKQPGIGVS
jgi:PAS domain S-box-containing protein